MNREKTIVEWLEELPDGYRELALKNYHNGYTASSLSHAILAHAILEAFAWKDTPKGQGDDFWYAVYDWVTGDGELPPLPEEEK